MNYKEDVVEEFLKKDGVLGILKSVKKRLEKMEDFTFGKIESELRALIEELNIKGGDLIHPLRVAVTGKSVSAGIFEVMVLLGKDKAIKRLEKVINEKF